MRLRWRLLTDWHPEYPRPNQLTPAEHVLCPGNRNDCETALERAKSMRFASPEMRSAWLLEHGHVDWLIWLILTGRGWGKTRVGAEDIAEFMREHPRSRTALVGATFADVRDTMVEGESGLLSVLHPSELLRGTEEKAWNRSIGELVLANGARAKAFSAEKPKRLRGPQHHRAWADELAAWENLQMTWDMLMFGLRLGANPQVIITTTPQPLKLLLDVRARPTTVMTTGTMYDNIHNLAPGAVAELKRKYENTRLGRQELLGHLLEEAEGALWKRRTIDRHRVTPGLRPLELTRVVVAIDPAMSVSETSDETGIVAAGKGVDGHGYVLGDRSGKFLPLTWAKRALLLWKEFEGDHITAEVNNGGDLVKSNIRAVDDFVPVNAVNASRGKRVRAEPVSSLYEQGLVHHVGTFAELEDQMCGWDPDSDDDSPDRVDALVYALTDLMLGLPKMRKRQARDTRLDGRR